MDVRSLDINLAHHEVHVRLLDAGGLREYSLTGEAAGRVIAAAEPLLVRLSQEGNGPVQRLSIDAEAGRISTVCLSQDAASDGDGDRIDDEPAGPAGGPDPDGFNTGEVGEVPPHLHLLVYEGDDYRHARSLLREPARVAAREARPRQPDPADLDTDAARWEDKYRRQSDGWELMRAAPPLARWLAAHPPQPGIRALVPGCGRGHEALLLAAAGVEVTAVDIAPTAVAETRRLAEAAGLSQRVTAAELDIFDLPEAHQGTYDLVLEHCCFCAIDPARRDEYVAAVARALRPGGELLGLFWCHDYPGGPPYGSTPAEVRDRFAARFALRHGEMPEDSVLARAHQEYLTVFTRADEDPHALLRP